MCIYESREIVLDRAFNFIPPVDDSSKVYIHKYVCVYIYVYMYIYVYIYIGMHTYMYMCMVICVFI
jgi:hypothetical protein